MIRRKKYIFLILIGVIVFLWTVRNDGGRPFKEFSYPLEGNLTRYVKQLLDHNLPDILPINKYDYKFLTLPLCDSFMDIQLIIIVKSATHNFRNRQVIRETWGDVMVDNGIFFRTLFHVGMPRDSQVQEYIQLEMEEYEDLIQSDFIDTYYNNTIKTMMSMRYVLENCLHPNYYLLVDDDYYVSVKNLMQYLASPRDYPNAVGSSSSSTTANSDKEMIYAGYVHEEVNSIRNPFSKWYISMEEYPFITYPNFVSAGAMVFSQKALATIYYTALYTRHFRFDDVFIGIAAYKANLAPMHHREFYNSKKVCDTPKQCKYVIASHGYGDVDELKTVWLNSHKFKYA